MTIGDYPELLALGFLRNQGMLHDDDNVWRIDFDEELETVVVRTERQTSYEHKLRKITPGLRGGHRFWRYDGGAGGADPARCAGAHLRSLRAG